MLQLVSKGVVEPRDTKGKAAKNLRMVRGSRSYRGIIVSLDSPVLVMHDGVTK